MRDNTIGEAVGDEMLINNIRQIHLQVQETLNKSREKYTARHDQHRVEKTFKVGDRVWLHLNKERLQGPSKNYKIEHIGLWTNTQLTR